MREKIRSIWHYFVRRFWYRQPTSLGVNERPELTPDAFEKMFGFRPKEPLSKEKLEACQSIQMLFDDMKMAFGMQSLAIFKEAMPQGALRAHSTFLMDVSTCPKEVVGFCQKTLAHDLARREGWRQEKARVVELHTLPPPFRIEESE